MRGVSIGVWRLIGVTELWIGKCELLIDTVHAGGEESGAEQMWCCSAVSHAMLNASSGAALARHANSGDAIVETPVGPVAAEHAGG